MLHRFGAKNFYCFKEGVEISLELGASCPKEISKGEGVSKLLCLKGANASGKTNALKALGFLRFFCVDSFSLKPDEEIPVSSFFENSNPIELFCEFDYLGTFYRYELTLDKDHVIEERLFRRSKRLISIFQRIDNTLKSRISDYKDLDKVNLRKNASLISTAIQYESKSISDVSAFFSSITHNVSATGKQDLSRDYRFMSKFYNDFPQIFEQAKSLLTNCDLGISDIQISKAKDEKGKEYFYPTFICNTDNPKNWLLYHDQSTGTQTLFNTVPYYLITLASGGILIMDEFDTDFHPHILKLLVSLFDSAEKNPNKAQMIFSTHNTEILDYMSKYRTYIFNKESCESYGYRLDEIPGEIIRNDRSIIPLYNSGKIGGVPKI